jgi:hypothetical protein
MSSIISGDTHVIEKLRKRGRPLGSAYPEDDEAILRIYDLRQREKLSLAAAIRRVVPEMKLPGWDRAGSDPGERIRKKYARRLKELLLERQVQNRSVAETSDQSTVRTLPVLSKIIRDKLLEDQQYLRSPEGKARIADFLRFSRQPGV